MNSREIVKKIAARQNSGGNAYWSGHPHPDTEKNYLAQMKLNSVEELFCFLNDDCRWLRACPSYQDPEGKPMYDVTLGKERKSLSEGGCFADCTDDDLDLLAKFPWPRLEYLNFTETLASIRNFPEKAVFSGFWSAFFHVVSDFFGMENYFVKMYTDPAIVEAVTNKVVDFFVEANEMFLKAAGDSFDIVFMGSDFGTQLDLLVSPECFRKFILPGIKRLVGVAKKYGKFVMWHSCGSIYKIIPDLIDTGIDILHPLQARAQNMDANTLAKEFKQDLAFCGGVDTQDLLIHATPQQIREEVLRLREIFGENYIVGPSHEELLNNIPLENVIAMARAAKE